MPAKNIVPASRVKEINSVALHDHAHYRQGDLA